MLALQAELEEQHQIKVKVILADLTDPTAAQTIYAATEAEGIIVDILINNAGIGGHGKFFERELTKDLAMIQLNITSLVNLTHLYLQGMVTRGRGRILNVSSTASFMPGPLQAVYYASKAFVTSFSQALANELKSTGVTVTALCPGAVTTGFQTAGNLEGVAIWDKAKTAEQCAKIAYKDMTQGKLLSFNEASLRFLLNWIIPLLPRQTVLKISRQFMEKK